MKTDFNSKDVERVAEVVLENMFEYIGDEGSGGRCRYCGKNCSWNAEPEDMTHELDCVIFVAKDLLLKP